MAGTNDGEGRSAQSEWHALDADAVLDAFDSSRAGLATKDAAARLQRYGPNRLTVAPATSAWSILLDQVRSLVVLLLFAAAGVALLLGELVESIAILAVLLINTVLGFATELRARRAMESLLQLDVASTRVIRDGTVHDVDAADVVPGDVIAVEAGDAVPADARLLDAREVRVDEAALTGESLPVSKHDAIAVGVATPVADRVNMLYKGTALVAGAGRAIVVATAMDTQVGRIGTLVGGIEEERTPLERRLDQLGRRLVWLTIAIAAAVAGMGILRGVNALQMLETGIALAIAAVPEGLPAVATIALGVGLRRMASRRALIRRLPAVEALGSATVICTDKTGTLTAGEMTVTEIQTADSVFAVTGAGYEPVGEIRRVDGADAAATRATSSDAARRVDRALDALLRVSVLVNRARVIEEDGTWTARGDPTEAALIVLARKADIRPRELRDGWPEQDEVPFSSERKLMATFNDSPDGRLVVHVKGGPGAVIERCDRVRRADADVPLDERLRGELRDRNHEMASRGLRVLAFACGVVPGDRRRRDRHGGGIARVDEALSGLIFLGFTGMIDPPAEGVPQTIRSFRDAGIRTVMLTGDQPLTAESIARRLGVLEDDEATLSGRELFELDDAALTERVRHVGAFARVAPEAKLRIIEALQRRGEIVAMLGDGVNDAAALKKADIGVAMGKRGTDVAKDAADVILQDDRFPTIGAAIEQGRVIFDNIRKFVFYLFSCNLAEVLVLFVAGLVGWPLPLLPLQILWLNLVTDTLPALALALEPAEPGVMRRPPRDPAEAILSRTAMTRVAAYALLITAVTLGAFMYVLLTAPDPEAAYPRAVTWGFMTLALAQIFHLGNARSEGPVLSRRAVGANPWALGAVAVAVSLQFAAIHLPGLARLLRLTPLDLVDWAVLVGLGLVPAVVGQFIKLIRWRGDQQRSSRA